MTPTLRTIHLLRSRGYIADRADSSNWRFSSDYLGFGDIVAFDPDGRGWIIQATSGDNHAARRKKITRTPDLAARALECMRRRIVVAVFSWAKRGARGKRKTYEVREDVLGPADFDSALPLTRPKEG